MSIPLNVTEFGVRSDKLCDEFFIYFHSEHNLQTVYLGDDELVATVRNAIKSTDIQFVTDELIKLLHDDDFLLHLEATFAV